MSVPSPSRKKQKTSTGLKLYRYRDVGWLGGVCAGIAYKLKVPTWMVRLGTVAAVLFLGLPLFVYILFWIFMPAKETPADYRKVCE